MDSQTSEFFELKDIVKKKREQIYILEKELRHLKLDIKKQITKLQHICNHDYIRECTTSGCYAEYHYICKYCDYWK